MKKFNLNLKKNHILILFLIIIIGANFLYFDYFFRKIKRKQESLNLRLIQTNNIIYEQINIFYKNLNIFKNLKDTQNKVIEKEYEISYLKKRIKFKKDILDIFKTLVLQSNVKLKELKVISDKKDKNKGIIFFSFTGEAPLENFVELLDKIENKNNYLIVDSYKLKKSKNQPDILDIEMKIKFIYIIS